MYITATELKQNLEKYLIESANEDVYITQNGKTIARITSPSSDMEAVARSLAGILPDSKDFDEVRDERY